MKIDMDDIEIRVSGTELAEDRVAVRAVIVELGVEPVRQGGDLLDMRVEESERVRIGKHDRRGLFAENPFERLGNEHAGCGIGRHRPYRESGYGGA